MKFIFCHLLNDRSGSPAVLSKVIDVVQSEQIEYVLFTSKAEDGFLNEYSDRAIYIPYFPAQSKLITLWRYLKSQTILFRHCVNYKNDSVIFYINTLLPFGAALAAFFYGKKIVYHVHEETIKPQVLGLFLKFVAVLSSSTLIFPSFFIKSSFLFKNSNSIVVHNGIDLYKTFHPRVRTISIFSFKILMVCSLKLFKGVNEFLLLAKRCVDHEQFEFTLVLNASLKEIEDFFNAVDLPKNLTIYPRQESMNKFYLSNDILLNLTRPNEVRESFGLTILEGMCFGLPCIVPPVGGPAEIVDDGIQGFHISCFQTEKIFEKLMLLYSDIDLYNKLSKNALMRTKDFDATIFREKFKIIIQDINEKS